MENEIWKTIEGFEEYQVSNLGRVKSIKQRKEVILRPRVGNHRYYQLVLYKDSKPSTKLVHRLVATTFLNPPIHTGRLVVNHIDSNRLNNILCNLELVTQRKNCSLKSNKGSSQFTGVSWHKGGKKWNAAIGVGKKRLHLGSFTDELEASKSYEKALKSLTS